MPLKIITILTNKQVLQTDVVGVCFKEISSEDKAGFGAHRTSLHLRTTMSEKKAHVSDHAGRNIEHLELLSTLVVLNSELYHVQEVVVIETA